MGLRCELNIFRDWGFPEKTSWGGGIIINYSEPIAHYAQLMYQFMLERVPVLTGNLKHSLRWEATNSGFVIETECEYAEYVEYGTCYMDAQPYFEPAIEAYAGKLFEDLKPIYTQSQSESLREYLLAEEAKAVGALQSGGDDSTLMPNTSGPQITVYWPDTGPFKTTVTGKITAASHQMSDPSRWRRGTTMRMVAEKLEPLRSRYFDGNMAKPQYRPRVVAVGAARGGSGSFLPIGFTGDQAFDLALSIGAYAGVSLMATGTSLIDIVAGAMIGIIITTIIYLLLLNLINSLTEDPGEKIKYSQIEVEII